MECGKDSFEPYFRETFKVCLYLDGRKLGDGEIVVALMKKCFQVEGNKCNRVSVKTGSKRWVVWFSAERR